MSIESMAPPNPSAARALYARFNDRLYPLDEYPGWGAAPRFLEGVAASRNCRRIADIGGGANPMISPSFVQQRGIDYSLVDISQPELDKAPPHYTTKICVDLTAPDAQFSARVGRQDFDLAFSHMFLEHIADPVQAHRNILSLLKPGGLAVHLYPSANNLPLAVNRLVPEWLSTAMVKIAEPERDLKGNLGKFPAYYKLCGNPNPKLKALFESLGYNVLTHAGFVGHRYYRRFPVLRDLEKRLRPLLIKAGIGMTTAQLLVLEKR